MDIVEKKKGKHRYFYLRHSIRENKKVITKDKYLGKEIPKNIEEIKSSFLKKIRPDINKKLNKIRDNFQAEWDRVPQSARKKELEEESIAFTYNTNAIEGSTITLE